MHHNESADAKTRLLSLEVANCIRLVIVDLVFVQSICPRRALEDCSHIISLKREDFLHRLLPSVALAAAHRFAKF